MSVPATRTPLSRKQSGRVIQQQDRNWRQLKVQIAQDEASGPDPVLSVGMYLGFLVPGAVMTPIGALSSPAAMAQRIRVQNAPSLSI